jgi:Rrf2 family protein
MNISKTALYAIKLLTNLANNDPDEKVMVEDLAREEAVPKAYAAKILQKLARYEIITSYKGRGGGFRINADKFGISIFELIQQIDGKVDFDKCLIDFTNCTSFEPCPFREKWNGTSNQFTKLLLNYKLSDLAYELQNNGIDFKNFKAH